ncbi:MAG: hypothetical protein AAFP70_00895, partial [Calditrichota bacterium]
EALSLHLAGRRQQHLHELEQSVKASFDVLEGWEGNLPATVSAATISPLIYLRDMLQTIRKLPYQDPGHSDTGNSITDEKDHLSMWWRATLGQYHTRMEELNTKVVKLWQDAIEEGAKRETFIQDQPKVIEQLESGYKHEVNCELKVACSTCLKRTCATGQLLRQAHFFSGELISFLQEREHQKRQTV